MTLSLLLAAPLAVAIQAGAGTAAGREERVRREIVTLIESSEARRAVDDLDRAARLVDQAFGSATTAEAAYARARLVAAQSELTRATRGAADADKELDRAIEYAEVAISERPDWALPHAALADALGRRINVSGAFAALRHGRRVNAALAAAQRLDPSSVEVLLALGRHRLYAPGLFGGSTDGAVDAFRRAVLLEPSRPTARFWLGRALEESGADLAAAAEYRKALELEPEYVEARQRLERLEAGRRPATRAQA